MLQMKLHKNALEKEKYLWTRIHDTDVKCSNCGSFYAKKLEEMNNSPGTVLVLTDPVGLDCDLVNGLK